MSASKDATLKLLIRLIFCGGGTVGLVIVLRTAVTVMPDDFIMNGFGKCLSGGGNIQFEFGGQRLNQNTIRLYVAFACTWSFCISNFWCLTLCTDLCLPLQIPIRMCIIFVFVLLYFLFTKLGSGILENRSWSTKEKRAR